MGVSIILIKTKDIALISIFTALLIGGQLALSGIAGVEIVTVILTCYCYRFGIKRGIILVNVFSVMRCFLFGFFPNVAILYFIYYNLFAIIVGLIGNKCKRTYSIKNHIIVIIAVIILTALFTVFDDIITPVFYGYDINSTKAYFVASLYTMVTQVVCSCVSIALLFPPIIRILKLKDKDE